jgi:DNA-binding transcriptional ArsR family regulator
MYDSRCAKLSLVSERPPDPRVAILKELADPLRLRVVDRLGHRGPATVSELAAELAVPLPQLSNHLRRLRDARLVSVRRTGRHAVYALADEGLHALLPLLDRLTGRLAPPREPQRSDWAQARTCYEHLAGRLGVDLYRALVDRDALRSNPDGTLGLGPGAADALASLGIEPEGLAHDRRRLAFECFDATEHAPHVAGAVGDALARALAARGWTEPAGERVLRVTPAGATGLRETLGIVA